jgi:hypothetical protein
LWAFSAYLIVLCGLVSTGLQVPQVKPSLHSNLGVFTLWFVSPGRLRLQKN